MAKVVLILLVFGAIVWWLRRSSGASASSSRTSAARGGVPAPGAGPEAMVHCAVCGTYLPRAEAIELVDGDGAGEGRGRADAAVHVCGEPHRLEYEQRRGAAR